MATASTAWVVPRSTPYSTAATTDPLQQRIAALGLPEVDGDVRGVLATFSALDVEGAYSNAETKTLAKVLLPDMVTYDTTNKAVGPLNGRALSDDVIDAELNVVTGGFPFDGRDGDGAIGSDCVGAHDDYRNSFPYLGEPHA